MILFIRGFNTDNTTIKVDHYSNIDNFFYLSTHKLTYFNYNPSENLDDVYNRLENQILNNKYNILIAHSMGGGLLLKFLTSHSDLIKNYQRIIFLMPFICKLPILNYISRIPFIDKLLLPKGLVFPNNFLYSSGNIYNDSFNLLECKQIITMHNYMSSFDINLLNKSNCILIYARDEKFNVITDDILKTINNKIILDGKHEMWNEFENSVKFFKTLAKLLE